MTDLLERIQADTTEALRAVPGLSLARLIADNKGDLETEVRKSLGKLDDTSGKIGLMVLVLMPEVDDVERNLPRPTFRVKVEIQTIEQVHYNRHPTKGTGIRSSQAALEVLTALHQQSFGSIVLYADGVRPIPVENGFVSHGITFFAEAAGINGSSRPAPVAAELNEADALVLTCATPGAAIWWTADGSYPRPGASSANLYTAPISGLLTATSIRAAAYLPDQNPGDVINITVTTGPPMPDV